VWSETALRYPLQEWRPYYERNPAKAPLFKVIRGNEPWWLFGNPYFQDYDPEKSIRGGGVNATVLMNPQAQIVDYYGKIQQVPFAEYIPYWEVPAVQNFFIHVVGLAGSWELGRQLTVFEVPLQQPGVTVKFSTPICFEDAFAGLNRAMVAKGAEVLINLTNDSWSHRDSSQQQHFVAAIYRAVENRVPLVRSTNSGVSGVIDAKGRLVAGPLPSFQAGHLAVTLDLPSQRPMTLYNQYGDWLIAFFTALLVLILALATRRDTRGHRL
jgi:apolipoprotein N-acyltransferase